MSIKNAIKLCLFTMSLINIGSIQAAVPQWQIIPAESKLTFTGTQNGAPVSGEFKSFTGTLAIDPKDLKSSSIDIIVDISSISLSYAELKTTLIGADWFDVKMFPKAEFKSTSFEKIDDKHYEAKGTLTIRDKSEPVTLSFSAEEATPDKGVVVGKTSIKRSFFGVGKGEWAGTDEIKDEVVVDFKIVAVKK